MIGFKKDKNIYVSIKTDYEKVLDFYEYKRPTTDGHYLFEVLNFTHFGFEANHGFIQWLFPTTCQSLYNLNAPVLTKEELSLLGKNPNVYNKIKNIFLFICKMYGFEIDDFNRFITDNVITLSKSSNYTGYWITQNNHNYLRITRIISSLSGMGFYNYAAALLKMMETLYEEYPNQINEISLQYWREAIKQD